MSTDLELARRVALLESVLRALLNEHMDDMDGSYPAAWRLYRNNADVREFLDSESR